MRPDYLWLPVTQASLHHGSFTRGCQVSRAGLRGFRCKSQAKNLHYSAKYGNSRAGRDEMGMPLA